MSQAKLGGTFTFPGTSLTVHRMGYGAMQLAGPGVYGPPKILTPPSPSCAPRLPPASTTSILRTFMARTSPTSSSARPFIRTPLTSSS